MIQTKTSYWTSTTVERGTVQRKYINLWCLHFWVMRKLKDHKWMNTEEVRKTEEWKSNMNWCTRSEHREMWRAIVGWGWGGWNIQMLLCLCPLNEAGAKTATHHSGNWNARGQTRASSMSDNHSICFLSPSYTISAVKKPILSTAIGFSETLLEIRLTLTSFSLIKYILNLLNIYI